MRQEGSGGCAWETVIKGERMTDQGGEGEQRHLALPPSPPSPRGKPRRGPLTPGQSYCQLQKESCKIPDGHSWRLLRKGGCQGNTHGLLPATPPLSFLPSPPTPWPQGRTPPPAPGSRRSPPSLGRPGGAQAGPAAPRVPGVLGQGAPLLPRSSCLMALPGPSPH